MFRDFGEQEGLNTYDFCNEIIKILMKIMLFSQSDIITCAQEVEMMIKQLGAQLEQLKMTVKSKAAIPTSQVFVSFCHPL